MRKTVIKYGLFIGIILFIKIDLIGQINDFKYDSLVRLTKSHIDTIKLNALKNLTWECRFSGSLQGFEFGFDGLALAEKLGRNNDIAVLHNYIGVLAIKIKSFDKAKVQIKMAYHFADSLNIPTEKAYALNNLGEIYSLTGNLDSAIISLKEAIELFKSINNIKGLAYAYNQMGFAMLSQKKFDEAVLYHFLALEIREKLNDQAFVTGLLQNIGSDLLEKGSFAEARKYFEKMDTAQLKIRANFSIPNRLILIGKTYQGENNIEKAIDFYKQGLQLADKLNLHIEMRDAAKLLSDIYTERKDYKTALSYFNTFKAMNDSVKSSNLIAEYKQLDMKKEFDQKYKYLEYKMQQDINNQKLKLYWSKVLIYCLFGFFVIVFIFIIALARNFKTIAKKNKLLIIQKQDIESKNEAILKQHDELFLANATKDKFFSIIAHDLRGPIGNFHTFTNLIIEKYQNEIDEKLMDILLVINTSSQQTYTLLENLLTWARSQQGSIIFNPVIYNIYHIVENNINLLQGKADDKKISIQNLLSPELVCKLDNYMIDTVIRNLLSNAIKFTHENGTITFSATIINDSIEIKVSDTGIGMSQTNIDQLFRIDIKHNSQDGTNGEKGTGLGLILCKEFIEKHDGKIWAQSELGKGSDFIFTLPLNTIIKNDN